MTSTAPRLPLPIPGCFCRRRGRGRRDGPFHRANREPVDPPRATNVEARLLQLACGAPRLAEDSQRSGDESPEPSKPGAASRLYRLERSRMVAREPIAFVEGSQECPERRKASIVRGSLDLSQGVLKVCMFVRQTASSRCPGSSRYRSVDRVGGHLSAGHESRAPRAQSDTMCSRACQGGEN
jgi:hypothetical protein